MSYGGKPLDTVEVRSSSLLVPTSFNGLAILGPFFVAPKRSISRISAYFFKLQVNPLTDSRSHFSIHNKDAGYSTSFRAPPSEISGTASSKFSGRIIWTTRCCACLFAPLRACE